MRAAAVSATSALAHAASHEPALIDVSAAMA
jgi:hypothetical protein